MINVCVIDDELDVQRKISKYLDAYSKEKQMMFVTKYYTSGISFLEEYEANTNIVFFDIEMEEMNGLDAAARLRTLDENVSIVFITNIAKYAIRGYEVNALDYLVKPVQYEAFSRMMDKITKLVKKTEHNIIVNTGDGIKKLNVYDVLYIESNGASVLLHTQNETYHLKKTLKALEAELETEGFLRCNHCYLINTKYVTGMGRDTIKIRDIELRISRNRKKEFIRKLAEKMGNEIIR